MAFFMRTVGIVYIEYLGSNNIKNICNKRGRAWCVCVRRSRCFRWELAGRLILQMQRDARQSHGDARGHGPAKLRLCENLV